MSASTDAIWLRFILSLWSIRFLFSHCALVDFLMICSNKLQDFESSLDSSSCHCVLVYLSKHVEKTQGTRHRGWRHAQPAALFASEFLCRAKWAVSSLVLGTTNAAANIFRIYFVFGYSRWFSTLFGIISASVSTRRNSWNDKSVDL